MNENLMDLMRNATRLTRGGQLMRATALLQQTLGGNVERPPQPPTEGQPSDQVLDGCVFELRQPDEAVEELSIETRVAPNAWPSGATSGKFVSDTHTHSSLTRHYKLYVPPDADKGLALPLVVMLHGCTQDPDDFATGTGMNELARQQGFFVLYPAQSQEANTSRCWNWFKHNHQQRDRGEPALVASLTRTLVQAHRIDATRVFVAGLSAGGAMAAIMGAAYPDIYAAVGVHSGLAPGVATNLGEALSAMNGMTAGAKPLAARGAGRAQGAPPRARTLGVPTIVFHGDQDSTVNPVNGNQVIEARLADETSGNAVSTVEQGTSAHGQNFTRKVYRNGNGEVLGEHWLLHGAGHAWSGGMPSGSYTDARGPDAAAEMLRFFLQQEKRPAQFDGG